MSLLRNSPQLWQQLQRTVIVILEVRNGRSGTAAIADVPFELRNGVQALAFHAWRNMGRAQALRSLLVQRTPPPAVDTLLCLALSLGCNAENMVYDEFTLVNQTVEAAKKTLKIRNQANFINACLRKFFF